jgi:hypothetical protein
MPEVGLTDPGELHILVAETISHRLPSPTVCKRSMFPAAGPKTPVSGLRYISKPLRIPDQSPGNLCFEGNP